MSTATFRPAAGACPPAAGACPPAAGACPPAAGACPPAAGACPPAARAAALDQPAGAPGPLRLLPAPVSDPPYDDERDGQPLPLRAAGVARPRLRLVPRPAAALVPAPVGLPPASPFARSLVQRLLEVLAGVRPLAHLQRDTSRDVYEQLERALLGRPRPTGLRPDGRAVRSVHVQVRPDGRTAEACATVRRDGRYTALALRLERPAGSWTCTELVGA